MNSFHSWRWHWISGPTTSTSQIFGITGVCHHLWLMLCSGLEHRVFHAKQALMELHLDLYGFENDLCRPWFQFQMSKFVNVVVNNSKISSEEQSKESKSMSNWVLTTFSEGSWSSSSERANVSDCLITCCLQAHSHHPLEKFHWDSQLRFSVECPERSVRLSS